VGLMSEGMLAEVYKHAKTLNPATEADEVEKVLGAAQVVSDMAGWFWELVEGMDTAKRAKLLAFACGTGRLPADGFRALKPPFRLDIAENEPPSHLPSAHTCFNQLCLPAYPSKEHMAAKLDEAIANATGFGFV